MGVDSSVRRAVFLDRDGVINRALIRDGKPFPPAGIGELDILPNVFDALTRLRTAGFLLIVVTNQPDVARGTERREIVDDMHAHIGTLLPIDDFRICDHDDDDDCRCRKPKDGLLRDAARAWNIDLAQSFLVGDRWRDIDAGSSAGCTTVFIDYCYNERRPERCDVTVASLGEAADWILANNRSAHR